MKGQKQGGINWFAHIFLLPNYRIKKMIFLLRKIKKHTFVSTEIYNN